MKTEETEKEMDLGYQIVPEGVYIWQFDEKIDLMTKEETKSQTFKLPMICDKCIEGSVDGEGRTTSNYINIQKKDGDLNEFGEKQMASILTITGLMNDLADKAGGDVDLRSDKFVNWLKLSLPGKFIKMKHAVVEGEKGKNINWLSMSEADGASATGSGGAKKKDSKPAETGDKDSW